MGDVQPSTRVAPLSADEVRQQTKISEDFYTAFSNQFRVAASATEFRLFFGESYPTADGKIEITENLSIVLGPAQAKALAKLLLETINNVEKVFGVIPELTELQARLSATPPTE